MLSENLQEYLPDTNEPHFYILEGHVLTTLTSTVIEAHSSIHPPIDTRGFFDLVPTSISLDSASFSHPLIAQVTIHQQTNDIIARCTCNHSESSLCESQRQVLYNLVKRDELRIFFDDKLRHTRIRQIAIDYGLEQVTNLDKFFELEYTGRDVSIKPRMKELFPVNETSQANILEQLFSNPKSILSTTTHSAVNAKYIVVLRKHKYYDHLTVELLKTGVTREGKVKSPLESINPLDLLWTTNQTDELRFYTAIAKFQHNYDSSKSETDIEGLTALIKNPLELDFFYHDANVSSQINASSIVPIQLKVMTSEMRLSVDQKGEFFEITGQLVLEERAYALKTLQIKYDYFIQIADTLYLIANPDLLRLISFFKKHHNSLIVHQSRYERFRETILSRLENQIQIIYSYVKPATPQQLALHNFTNAPEYLIYLSDWENYVLITPVIRYGEVEVPVLSKKQIYSLDLLGKPFMVDRNETIERWFTAIIFRQHLDFMTQAGKDFFFLPKKDFLNEDWFLDVFEEWTNQNITIFGFNDIKNNSLNQNKAKISILVNSGIDWFDTTVTIRYGKEKVSLKHLLQAVRNKSKFVQLGDGTQGILPQEWIEKLASYFQAGEVVDESIRTAKVNFSLIEELYDEDMLSADVQNQLKTLRSRIAHFDTIETVPVPHDLQATLRSYQHQGLNWLHFLDEFGFGGCLADDMGLGKTIQVLAFILSQRNKVKQNTNLVVVPTSLIFNWQAEIEKFAPSIQVLTLHGAYRITNPRQFDAYEIVLTTYGTLLSDIRFLKHYSFNYVILDESQAIKNPDSQRYKAVRMLQSRNRIVLTGTPVENNTFDLYSQLSFACPGLLGTRQRFKDIYAIPIDRFKDSQRARELQKRIHPFILRRTKKQVAHELPEKTEMVIYCEMGTEQRNLYNAYTDEFRNFLLTKDEGDLTRETMHILQGLTKLRQICDSPALLSDEAYYGTASAKLDALLEEIENKSPYHKILVFSQFVTMLDLIRTELQSRNISFAYLTGQTQNRAEQVETFQTEDNVRVFLISMKAGGIGLNLTEADYVYLVDPWWNPAVENQAIDRCYRIGQKKNVVAVRLICPNTIEEKIMKLQETKKDLVGDLIKTDSDMLKSLSRMDLLALLG
ncbi:DEAD/DEAH box helicase [Xanthocytophaga flava]|uniref:DEAD/DEAH box helicase n=1 Tax=Xanthocytophaga flava TaxID=3048013 RepID=UPI0028D5A042|nr:SNF2-related protein [Xanthocytophaga flavus]MDJ1470447.1 SNF2-related protein [Xanthocytophaga flavus]